MKALLKYLQVMATLLFNKIFVLSKKKQMTSGQGNHWLIKESNNYSSSEITLQNCCNFIYECYLVTCAPQVFM